jgi:hypothetical protein
MWSIRWVAQYSDGTVVNQYGGDGTEISYEKLDRGRIAAFALWDFETKKSILTLHLEPGQKLIYRRRVEMKQVGDQEAAISEVCYLVGWRRTVAGECIQSIAYVFEKSGRIELAGRFDAKHPWFYSPVLRPFEE